MTARTRLPNRRESEIRDFVFAGHCFTLGLSRYLDGRPAEVFISSSRPGSPIEAIARDAAIAASFALQHGADLQSLRSAMTRDHDGGPASPLGTALDAISDGVLP